MININILYSKKAIPLRGSVNFRLPTIGTAIEDWQLQSGFTCVYTIFTWNFQISEKVIKRTERVLLYGSPSVSSSDTLITTRHFSVLITKSSASKQKFILTIDPWSGDPFILDPVFPGNYGPIDRWNVGSLSIKRDCIKTKMRTIYKYEHLAG